MAIRSRRESNNDQASDEGQHHCLDAQRANATIRTMTPANDEVVRKGREIIANVFANPGTFSRYNDLLRLFFRGLPIPMLRDLLRHTDERVIAGALFIAEELHGKATTALEDVVVHARHENPRIRISAMMQSVAAYLVSRNPNSSMWFVG